MSSNAIKIGDVVQAPNDISGRVAAIRGDQVRIKTKWNEDRIYGVSQLTKKDVIGGISEPAISITEVGANVASFAMIEKFAMKKPWWNPETKNFIIADAVAETFAHPWMQSSGYLPFDINEVAPLTSDESQSYMPSELSLKMAANKLVTIAVIDSALRAFMKQSQTKGRVTNLIKTFAALVLGNSSEKLLRAQTSAPSFRPR